ncbi:hypothetical protein HPB50_005070 [Hyalomma asiaticum]|uniref:Uncharacterized protein n=1 Tax=Hyalomma asiaticum TaxID=266040 RepID=A0ACB7SKS0_HYAAI|nr:hypothetical protein HPB50_005070 [Hyalomma asiaticum]
MCVPSDGYAEEGHPTGDRQPEWDKVRADRRLWHHHRLPVVPGRRRVCAYSSRSAQAAPSLSPRPAPFLSLLDDGCLYRRRSRETEPRGYLHAHTNAVQTEHGSFFHLSPISSYKDPPSLS